MISRAIRLHYLAQPSNCKARNSQVNRCPVDLCRLGWTSRGSLRINLIMIPSLLFAMLHLLKEKKTILSLIRKSQYNRRRRGPRNLKILDFPCKPMKRTLMAKLCQKRYKMSNLSSVPSSRTLQILSRTTRRQQ